MHTILCSGNFRCHSEHTSCSLLIIMSKLVVLNWMYTQRCSCPSALFVSRNVDLHWHCDKLVQIVDFFLFGMFLFGCSYRQLMLALISYTLFTNQIWEFDHMYWIEWVVSVTNLAQMQSGWILALISMLWLVLVCYIGEHMVTNNQALITIFVNLRLSLVSI